MVEATTLRLRSCPRCKAPVFWGQEHANFYCAIENRGCGLTFYELERERIALYPTSAADALAAKP